MLEDATGDDLSSLSGAISVMEGSDEAEYDFERLSTLWTRLFANQSIALTLLFVLVFGFLVVRAVLQMIFGNAVQQVFERILNLVRDILGILPCFYFIRRKKKNQVAPSEDEDRDAAYDTTYTKALAMMQKRGVASYKMRDNPKYGALLKAMDDLARTQKEMRTQKASGEPASPERPNLTPAATPVKE